MAEPAARIGLPTDSRDQQGALPRPKLKDKPRQGPSERPELAGLEAGEPDEQEKHELDTVA